MLHAEFIRRFSVRKPTELINPRMHPMGSFELPLESNIIFAPRDELELGLPQNDPILTGKDEAALYSFSVHSMAIKSGHPRLRETEVNKAIRRYHKTNRRIRNLRRMEQGLKDKRAVFIMNLAPIHQGYKYPRHLLTAYHRWTNISYAIMESVNHLAASSFRKNFVFLEAPDRLPTLEEFKIASKRFKSEQLEVFHDNRTLDMLGLWLWATNSEQDHPLKQVNAEALKTLNLVFMSGGQWCFVDMSLLAEWKEEKSGDAEGLTVFAKEFYRFLERIQEAQTAQADSEEEAPDEDEINFFEDRSAPITKIATELAEQGSISAAEYRRGIRLAGTFKNIPSPSGKGTLEDLVNPDKIDTSVSPVEINDIASVTDKNMLKSTLTDFDTKYVDEVMEHDIAGMVMMAQNAGVAVTGYKREEVVDALNHYAHYTVQFTPLTGAPSTVHFKMPIVGKDGKFLANGVRSRMLKQRGDVPIRKTHAAKVALTSYYGKTFVTRSDKRVNDLPGWAKRKVVELGMDDDSQVVTNLRMSNKKFQEEKLPRLYSGLASTIDSFTCKSGTLDFRYHDREQLADAATIKRAEKRGQVVCGKSKGKLITVDPVGTFYYWADGDLEPIGGLGDLLGTDVGKEPLEMIEIKVFNKKVPVAIVLSYLMGLDKLLRKLKVKHRTVPRGTRVELANDEVAITFADETLIYSKTDDVSALILNGFNAYKKQIVEHNYQSFNRRDVYFNVLEGAGLGLRHLREIDILNMLFVDPITDELLKEMKEPRDIPGLLIRSAELLTSDDHPEEVDTRYMRFKGYERFSGLLYKELVQALRKFHTNPMTTKAKVEVNPRAVWQSIVQDPSTQLVEELNPIHNLKEKELVTYVGEGGRSAQSMVRDTRQFDIHDMGVMSEATVDSGSVGINASMTANPNLKNLRGVANITAKDDMSCTRMLSTSANLAPAADRDDPKRVNFISIQHSHGVAGKGYQATPLGTGYEYVLGHRVDDSFCFNAPEDGKVLKVTKDHMLIEYGKDRQQAAIELGTTYGVYTGQTVPHTIVTDMDEGNRFKKGHALAWNSGFFERDMYEPTEVIWKAGVLVDAALVESSDTLEDSSAISEKLAGELATPTAKVRTILVNFDQSVHNLVAVGDKLTEDSILCTLEDPLTSNSDLFDEESRDTLRALSSHTPRAKSPGEVTKIEVIYYGEVEDMSSSLKDITKRADKERASRVNRLREKASKNGAINETLRIDGNTVTMDTAVIRITIVKDVEAGVGDKGVLGNALKTIFGRVMVGTNETEAGDDIDVLFSYSSIAARICLAPEIAGTTNKLCQVLSKKAAEVYKGNK